jgi:hypothetical protein
MSDRSTVYDLGSIDIAVDETRRVTQARPIRRVVGVEHAGGGASVHAGVDLPGFLSLLLPGLGQLACRQAALGLFFLSWIAVAAAAGWAVIGTLDRSIATLRVLGYPGVIAVWTLGGLYLLAALLHVTAVVTAGPADHHRAAHPVLTGLASAFVPGAGQILAGSRTRAVVFVSSLWAIAALWLLDAPFVLSRLDEVGVIVPDAVRSVTQPAVRWTAPAVVWALAVYDAVAGATAARD